MRLLVTPVYIASVCLSLVNGAEFAVSDDEQGFGRDGFEVGYVENVEDEGGMGERSDTSSNYLQDDEAITESDIEDGLKFAKYLETQKRLNDIRSGAFKGAGAFSCTYVGGGAPKERNGDSLFQEANRNNLVSVLWKKDNSGVEMPAFSNPETFKLSPDVATSRPSYMKRKD